MKFPKFSRVEQDLADTSASPVQRHRGHFRFNTISALVVIIFVAAAFSLQSLAALEPDRDAMGFFAAGILGAVALLFVLPYWPMVIAVVAGLAAASPIVYGTDVSIATSLLSLGFLIAPGFEIINQWDKVVVLRLGRFRRVAGPGIIFLLPLMDSIAGTVDTRIRVSDFSAEKSLTIDTVPVHVDALAFWMIWDAEKAILEVQDFQQAVVLSAQTALRASIGSNTLSTLLGERERLGEEIQSLVDAKTNPWGISIVSVEFKEILVPKELEDALSREAQAERERSARTILGSTEAEIASSFVKAADQYRDDPTALQLRAMNMIYESMRNKGGLVLAPATALSGMNMGAVLGAAAYGGKTGAVPDLDGTPSGSTTPDGLEVSESGQTNGIDGIEGDAK